MPFKMLVAVFQQNNIAVCRDGWPIFSVPPLRHLFKLIWRGDWRTLTWTTNYLSSVSVKVTPWVSAVRVDELYRYTTEVHPAGAETRKNVDRGQSRRRIGATTEQWYRCSRSNSLSPCLVGPSSHVQYSTHYIYWIEREIGPGIAIGDWHLIAIWGVIPTQTAKQ